jgi:hypothetical protein
MKAYHQLPPQLAIQELQRATMSSTNSTSLNRRSENVIVEAIMIPGLKLCNVKWHVFGANLVERPNNPALEDAPKTLNRLSVLPRRQRIALGMIDDAQGACSQPTGPCRAS